MSADLYTLPCDDRAAIGRFLAVLEPRSVGLARRLVREHDAASDVVQNAFEKALRCRRQSSGRCRASTWVYRIVFDEALQWIRSRDRRRRDRISRPDWGLSLGGADSLDDIVAAARERARVQRALQSSEDRELPIAAAEGHSMKSLAGRFGISAAGVNMRAFRARRKLACELGGVTPTTKGGGTLQSAVTPPDRLRRG